jgi:hypothetical protein
MTLHPIPLNFLILYMRKILFYFYQCAVLQKEKYVVQEQEEKSFLFGLIRYLPCLEGLWNPWSEWERDMR